MKKLLISVALILVAILSASAQEQTRSIALPKGKSVLSATVGFYSGMSNVVIPPISLSYEYVVVDFGRMWSVGVGAFGGVLANNPGGTTAFGGCICAQGNIHFSPIEPLDIYAGPYIGYANVGVAGFNQGAFAVGGMLGIRYFFTKAFGLNLQAGGLGTLNLGVSFRF